MKDPAWRHLPVVSSQQPISHSLQILFWSTFVSVNAVGCSFTDGFYHFFWWSKVHVCNPHRDQVVLAKQFKDAVPFFTVSVPPIDKCIELARHSCYTSLATPVSLAF